MDEEDPHPRCCLAKIQLQKILLEGPPLDSLILAVTSTWCLRDLLRAIKKERRLKGIAWSGIPRLTLNTSKWEEGSDSSTSMFKYLLPTPPSSLNIDLPYILDSLEDPFEESEERQVGHLHPVNIPPFILSNLTSFTISISWDGPQIPTIL